MSDGMTDAESFDHAERRPSVGAMIRRAECFMEVARYDLAAEELKRALAIAPDNAYALSELGTALWKLGRFGEAESALGEALALSPENRRALLHRSVMFVAMGRHVEAELGLIDAIRMNPEMADGYLHYGALMLKTKHLAKAERLLRHALALRPDDDQAHSTLAMVLSLRHAHQEAAEHAGISLALKPQATYNHLKVGLTHYNAGRPFKAREHCREALRLAPDHAKTAAAFHQADRACRWLYLPVYHFAIATDRLPGKQVSVAVAMLALHVGTASWGGSLRVWLDALWFVFVGFVVYTWVAPFLVDAWIRMRPAR